MVRLTIVDDRGATDTADLSIDAAASGSAVSTSSAPPATPASTSGGGGGGVDLAWLLLAAGAATARHLKSRSGSRRARA
jgi:hypothetical protein